MYVGCTHEKLQIFSVNAKQHILLLTSSEFLVRQVLTVMSTTCEHGLYHDGQLVSALRMACMTDLHRTHAIADRIVVFGWGSVMVCRACSPDLHSIEHL